MTTIEFDKKVKCGPEFVALRIVDNCDDLKVGDILLSEGANSNERLARCLIEDVGSKAAAEYGIKAGDYVMIDRLSTFAHTAPVCLTRYNNVICLTDKDGTDYRPLRNMVFVEPDQKDDLTDVGGFFVPNYADKLNTGVIVKANLDEELELPFGEGDRVMLVKGGDFMQAGTRRIHIFKHDMLICRIED